MPDPEFVQIVIVVDTAKGKIERTEPPGYEALFPVVKGIVAMPRLVHLGPGLWDMPVVIQFSGEDENED